MKIGNLNMDEIFNKAHDKLETITFEEIAEILLRNGAEFTVEECPIKLELLKDDSDILGKGVVRDLGF